MNNVRLRLDNAIYEFQYWKKYSFSANPSPRCSAPKPSHTGSALRTPLAPFLGIRWDAVGCIQGPHQLLSQKYRQQMQHAV